MMTAAAVLRSSRLRRLVVLLVAVFMLGVGYHALTDHGPSPWFVGAAFVGGVGAVKVLLYGIPRVLQNQSLRRQLLKRGWQVVEPPLGFVLVLAKLHLLEGGVQAFAAPAKPGYLLITGYQYSIMSKAGNHPSYILAARYPGAQGWVAGGGRTKGPGSGKQEVRARVGTNVVWRNPGAWQTVPSWVPQVIEEVARARPRSLPPERVLVAGGAGWIGIDLRTYNNLDDDTAAWIDRTWRVVEPRMRPVSASHTAVPIPARQARASQ